MEIQKKETVRVLKWNRTPEGKVKNITVKYGQSLINLPLKNNITVFNENNLQYTKVDREYLKEQLLLSKKEKEEKEKKAEEERQAQRWLLAQSHGFETKQQFNEHLKQENEERFNIGCLERHKDFCTPKVKNKEEALEHFKGQRHATAIINRFYGSRPPDISALKKEVTNTFGQEKSSLDNFSKYPKMNLNQ